MGKSGLGSTTRNISKVRRARRFGYRARKNSKRSNIIRSRRRKGRQPAAVFKSGIERRKRKGGGK